MRAGYRDIEITRRNLCQVGKVRVKNKLMDEVVYPICLGFCKFNILTNFECVDPRFLSFDIADPISEKEDSWVMLDFKFLSN